MQLSPRPRTLLAEPTVRERHLTRRHSDHRCRCVLIPATEALPGLSAALAVTLARFQKLSRTADER